MLKKYFVALLLDVVGCCRFVLILVVRLVPQSVWSQSVWGSGWLCWSPWWQLRLLRRSLRLLYAGFFRVFVCTPASLPYAELCVHPCSFLSIIFGCSLVLLLLPQPRGRGWVVRVSLVHSSDAHTRTVLVLSFPLAHPCALINSEYPSL